jgi:translation initiation factor IF-2
VLRAHRSPLSWGDADRRGPLRRARRRYTDPFVDRPGRPDNHIGRPASRSCPAPPGPRPGRGSSRRRRGRRGTPARARHPGRAGESPGGAAPPAGRESAGGAAPPAGRESPRAARHPSARGEVRSPARRRGTPAGRSPSWSRVAGPGCPPRASPGAEPDFGQPLIRDTVSRIVALLETRRPNRTGRYISGACTAGPRLSQRHGWSVAAKTATALGHSRRCAEPGSWPVARGRGNLLGSGGRGPGRGELLGSGGRGPGRGELLGSGGRGPGAGGAARVRRPGARGGGSCSGQAARCRGAGEPDFAP